MIKSVMSRKKTKKRQKKYPCLKICPAAGAQSDIVVLFVEFQKGTLVWKEKKEYPYPIGHQADVWAEAEFKPFDGEISLSNVVT